MHRSTGGSGRESTIQINILKCYSFCLQMSYKCTLLLLFTLFVDLYYFKLIETYVLKIYINCDSDKHRRPTERSRLCPPSRYVICAIFPEIIPRETAALPDIPDLLNCAI